MYNILPQPKEIKEKEGFLENPENIEKKLDKCCDYGPEGYAIKIEKNGILLSASTEKGLYYGEQTLFQLQKQFKDKLPCMEIFDKPKFSYRGYMLDCARHFFSPEEIKKQLDILSLLKINTFHWHLTDDQGWRIQIDKYPLLTEIGSKRKQTRGDGKEIKGFYTKQQIRDIISYAGERYIDIIPEIDIPGHFKAAISAYPQISCREKKVEVGECFGISADIACVGKDLTYQFCCDILNEVIELFPCEYIHLGGDEALKLYWIDCKDCQQKIKENSLKNEEELQGYFMSKMVQYANSKGKKVINWNDGMLGDNIEGDVLVQYWKESEECKKVVEKQIKKGRKIIYSPFYSFYLDYPCGMTPLKKTYNYKNIVDEKNIFGLESPLWTEFVDSQEKLEFMTYPRVMALAERAWSEKADYQGFLQRIEFFNKILEEKSINYNKNPNPNIIKGKMDVIRFFVNAYDKGLKENINNMRLTKKKLKNKYGNERKK